MEEAWDCVRKLFVLFDRRRTGNAPPRVCFPLDAVRAARQGLTAGLQARWTWTSWLTTWRRCARWTLCPWTRYRTVPVWAGRARSPRFHRAGVLKLTPCWNKQANIVQCLQEEQLESITFAQFREWAHGPEGEQKDIGYVFCVPSPTAKLLARESNPTVGLEQIDDQKQNMW